MIGRSESFRRLLFVDFRWWRLLAALAIASIILVVLATLTTQTQQIWLHTLTRVEQFRAAETASPPLRSGWVRRP